jgi:hypothetical protein
MTFREKNDGTSLSGEKRMSLDDPSPAPIFSRSNGVVFALWLCCPLSIIGGLSLIFVAISSMRYDGLWLFVIGLWGFLLGVAGFSIIIKEAKVSSSNTDVEADTEF